jgi:hypothetical protein
MDDRLCQGLISFFKWLTILGWLLIILGLSGRIKVLSAHDFWHKSVSGQEATKT